jgi:hypothetical protein
MFYICSQRLRSQLDPNSPLKIGVLEAGVIDLENFWIEKSATFKTLNVWGNSADSVDYGLRLSVFWAEVSGDHAGRRFNDGRWA